MASSTPPDETAPGDESVARSLVISYLTLRKAVGLLGIVFPVLLAAGAHVLGCAHRFVEPSISDYYGTCMRDVFVGVLFAIALFLFSYRGYERQDEVAGNLACVFAVGVALFPITSDRSWVQGVHYACAASLFLTFAYFSLFLFTKSDTDRPTAAKKKRNVVYVVCGAAIVFWIALIAAFKIAGSPRVLDRVDPVFFGETFALWSFGVSWMIKGEALLQDDPDDPALQCASAGPSGREAGAVGS